MNDADLLTKASEARQFAYAPYSNFQVGAALLCKNGRVFTGCNVENASYGLSMCAERTALFKAISEGIRDFSTIAVSVPKGGSPCGACRQVLVEFNPNMKVVFGDENGVFLKKTTATELLPEFFNGENLH